MSATANTATSAHHPVDHVPRLAPLGLQHVLAMYAGAVAVPLVVGPTWTGAGWRYQRPTRQLADGLRADGLSTVLGGVFNTFPYTAFAQNVGLVSLTGVKSRYVATFAGGVLVLLGLLPKLGGIVQGIPQGVLGGAGVALFGMVAASGVRTLSRVRFNNANVLVVAISLGVGLLPTVSPELYGQFPTWFQIIFNSGISAGALTAILLNLVFNSRGMQRRHGADEGEFSAHDAVRAAATDPSPDSDPRHATSAEPRAHHHGSTSPLVTGSE